MGIVGIDLDDCRDPATGEITDEAKLIVDQLRSYTEISPSGQGLRIFVYAKLPDGRRRKGPVEMYDSERFLTVTGHMLDGFQIIIDNQEGIDAVHADVFGYGSRNPVLGKPTELLPEDYELLKKAANAKNGAKFHRLYYDGDTAEYPSSSEADLALSAELAFWTNGDCERVDRLFRNSALYRPKWDEQAL